ncbi:MAG: DUF721 domain-containing protein [Tatlockia sp.]|nr:DUF721 domain-containing protein [Tatlockia sp.]
MRSITRCMNAQLIKLCERTIQLDELSFKMKTLLPENLHDNCAVASFNRGCLLIIAKNSAWATELRYRLPELRDKLRQEGLYQLTSIKISLPNFEEDLIQKKAVIKTAISAKARLNIERAAKDCSYQPLRDALYNLASETADKLKKFL